MIILAITVCLMADALTVQCQTEVFRVEQSEAACLAMLAPSIAWMREASAGLPVLVVTAACKRGTVA